MILDYSSFNVPDDYFCVCCKAKGFKLWRMAASSWINLLCLRCVEIDQDQFQRGAVRQVIGDYVPAIPTEDCSTYWGLTSIPLVANKWWHRLASRPNTICINCEVAEVLNS
jgi:hypothetical protein